MTWHEWVPAIALALWMITTSLRLTFLERRVRHLEWRK